MSKDTLNYIILFVLLLLVQVLICNRIALFDVAVPVIFIYFIIRLPIDTSVNWVLTLSFLMGFIVDLFADTPGVNALACTILAVVRRPIYFLYVPKDDKTKTEEPTLSTMGIANYSKFLLTLIAFYCFLMFSIDFFSFVEMKNILLMTAASTGLTFVLTVGIDSIMTGRSERL